MSLFSKLTKHLGIKHSVSSNPVQGQPIVETELTSQLSWFQEQLCHRSDVRYREFSMPNGISCALIYMDGMIDQKLLQQEIIAPVINVNHGAEQELLSKLADVNQVTSDRQAALAGILDGTVVMLIDGEPQCILFPLKSTEKRSIGIAQDENVIRGSKEAFVEDLETNLTMLRRRIKHPDFKMEKLKFGVYTNTATVLCYIEGICEQKLVDEVKARMSRIEIDAVLDSSYIEEYIEDNPFSPFPQVQYTERPDTMTASILEGRIGIFVDGSPTPIIVPVTLYMLLQSAEDYYQRFIAATWIRWIRYIFLLVSFLLPSIYIAVTTFHPEMLPPNLLVTVSAAREDVPFPAIVEALLMEITFEGLREAGLRIPKYIGQMVSIIGALVIGQSAVQAGVVSAPMVIVVSITGIASFIIPHFDLALTFRLLRFPVMVLAASFGLYGIIISLVLIYMHLVTLRSFGTPYLTPTAPMKTSDLKDVLVRAPWWFMKKRPILFGTKNRTRLNYLNRAAPDKDGD